MSGGICEMLMLLSGYMPQMMANAVPAAVSMMHGSSRGNVYKYPPMTMHNTQQQHMYHQQAVQQVPPSAVATQPVLVQYFQCQHVVASNVLSSSCIISSTS